MTCCYCRQPILAGERFEEWKDGVPWDHHSSAADCVSATARRCAEIAAEGPFPASVYKISREFGLAEEPKG